MKTLTGLIIFLFLCLAGISAQAQTPFELYDDFNSDFLDIEKWTTGERRDTGVMILDTVRELHGGRLRVMGRAFGNTVTVPNPPPPPAPLGVRAGDVNASFHMWEAVQGLKVSVKVNDVEVAGCPGSNTYPTYARARFAGFFFNSAVDPPSTPTDRTGDVLAQIRIQRRSDSVDRAQVLEVFADVFRCSDAPCINASGPLPAFLGSILLGQWATIEMDWDVDHSGFNFSINKESTVFVQYPWFVYRLSAPGNINTLGVSHRLANCPMDERAMGFMDAEFENLLVRELPSP